MYLLDFLDNSNNLRNLQPHGEVCFNIKFEVSTLKIRHFFKMKSIGISLHESMWPYSCTVNQIDTVTVDLYHFMILKPWDYVGFHPTEKEQ